MMSHRTHRKAHSSPTIYIEIIIKLVVFSPFTHLLELQYRAQSFYHRVLLIMLY